MGASPQSPYYPPRAPWYRSLREVGYSFLSATRLDRIRPPGRLGCGAFLLGLLVPGYAFAAHGRKQLGRWLMLAWLAGFAIGVIFLGSAWAMPLFGLLVSLHASSVLHLVQPWLKDSRPGFRLILSVLAVAALIVFGYMPIVRWVETHGLVPLQIEGRPIVVARGGNPKTVKRGDWVAYRLEALNLSSVQLREGFGLAPVLAVAGDHVEFGPLIWKVNGISRPRMEAMPVEGELTVPANCWFIWPRMHTVVQRGVTDATVEDALAQISMVDRSQFIGRPFRRWFFRDQHLP